MGQCCCPRDTEKNAPLLAGQNDEAADTKATGSAVAVESTKIQKNIVASDDQKAQEEKKAQPPNPTDEEDEKKEVIFTQKTDVLPGQCLINQTFDLEKDLNALKDKYKNKYKELLKRNIIDKSNNDCKVSEENSIKVMQFNMLADGLSTAYRWVATEKTFLNVDPECLQWTYRGIRLVEEIIRFSPDIIGIEECDQLEFLMKYLEPIGYKSFYQMKTSSPIKHIIKEICDERKMELDAFNMNNDGVAIIYKTNKFELLNEQKDIQYINMKENKEKVMALGVVLKCIGLNKEILFVITHLKSTKSKQGEELRERQINLLFKQLIKNEKNLPVILCCDLNANPIINKKGYEPLCYNCITNIDNGLGFKSVYKIANGTEPEYTTFKLREHGTDKHVLDYIFIKNGNWKVTAVLEIPNASNESDVLIPNWHYPSDHFSILAQLTWKEE